MGCFSWIYSDTKKAMKCGKVTDSYLLVPPTFQDKYGEYIHISCYDGYGHFGQYDVFDLVAEWNREYLLEDMLVLKEIKLENFGGLYDFEKRKLREQGLSEDEIMTKNLKIKKEFYDRAVSYQKLIVNRLNDYKNGLSDNDMESKYDKHWKREIGIDIASEDKQNTGLPYPIKITSSPMQYNNAKASKRDPNQGCW